MTPLKQLGKHCNKAAEELEYIIQTRYKFEDKLNSHDVVDLCDGDEVMRSQIDAMNLEILQRINDLQFLTRLQNRFFDNEITDNETVKQYNEFLTN